MVVFLDSSAGHEGIGDIIGLLLWVRPGGVYLRICERRVTVEYKSKCQKTISVEDLSEVFVFSH